MRFWRRVNPLERHKLWHRLSTKLTNESFYGCFRFQIYRYLIDSLVTLTEDNGDGDDDKL